MRNCPKRSAGRLRRWLSRLLFCTAGIAIGVYLWSVLRETVTEQRDERAFDLRQLSHAPATPHLPTPSHSPAPSRGRPATDAGGLVARLLIPRIGLRAVVREGADDHTLDVALGHVPGTALPGVAGNIAIAGHRDTLFRRLGDVARGDAIELESLSRTYVYRVDEISIVEPDEVSVLAPDARSAITLVTCYPFRYVGAAPKRYIVHARLVSQAPLSADGTSFAHH